MRENFIKPSMSLTQMQLSVSCTHLKQPSTQPSKPSYLQSNITSWMQQCTKTESRDRREEELFQYSLQREITPKLYNSYQCVGCEKTFKTSPLLKKHIKTHKGVLKCRQCSQKFLRYHSLNLHVMNMHSSDKEEPSSSAIVQLDSGGDSGTSGDF